jgi:response regulator of citrate/malate metabolism
LEDEPGSTRTHEIAMPETVHILLIDDDPAENLILRGLMKKVSSFPIDLHYCETMGEAIDYVRDGKPLHLVLIDNRLEPQSDFRENVPALRKQGFIGPVGVISASLQDSYFQKFEEYGADFRIDKSELDPVAIEFIVREYVSKAPRDPADF